MRKGSVFTEFTLPVAPAATVLALVVGLSYAAPATPPQAAGTALEQRFAAHVQPFLTKHCYSCHGNGKQKGDLTLDRFTSLASVQDDERTWKHVADMLRQKLMPPDTKPQPTQAEVDGVTAWINDALAFCDCSGPRDPGRVAIRRLNRTEYNNTIRDLLGVDFKPAEDFPADDTGYGFDNIADVLTMSPLLAEKYLAAAEQALDEAVETGEPLKTKTTRYDSGDLQASGDGNSNGDLTKNGEAFADFDFPVDGLYELRVRAAQQKFGDEPARMVLKLADQELQTYDVTAQRGDKDAPEFVVRLDVNAGTRRVAAAYVNNKVDNNNRDRAKRGDRNLYVRRIEITGPLYPPPVPLPESYRRIFVCTPGDADVSGEMAARQIVAQFAGRAFRRPAEAAEVDQLLSLYRMARAEGDTFEQGVKLALTATLVSPHFLFRIERDPAAGRPHRVTDYELATRLSYFLWSTMPDDELFRVAAAGRLHEPSVLEAQVKRMLADARSGEFVRNFIGQWLELRNLDRFTPDPKQYPGFDESLRAAMWREAELFFEDLVRHDGSVLKMLDADYTFLNERLARHYGIEGVTGEAFRRVPLAPETKRGGVLTMAGVLTVTAMPARTSPVKRGKFVLEQIIGEPPPPPPADVPALEENKVVTGATQRERLEKHREDPNCFVCHVRMDPIGFSLENFDATGAWRERDGGLVIDPSGKLPEGQSLDGPSGLKRVLLERKNDFVRCLVEKMMTYSLGRGLGRADKCTVKDVCEKVETDGYRFSSLVMGIVTSDAFQKRRARDAAAPLPAQAQADAQAPAAGN